MRLRNYYEVRFMFDQLDLFSASAPLETNDTPLQAKSRAQIKEDNESFLTPKEWELYRLIKYNSLVEQRKTTQKEICDKISGFEWNDDPKSHDHCVAIWNAIKNNNMSLEHEHIIISKDFCYWLGSQEENKQFLKDLWNALAPRLTRYWNYYKKLGLDGQGKLLDKNNNPIDDNSVSKRFFECFNAYNVSMQEYESECNNKIHKNDKGEL